jgi:hypothetical protein
MKLVREGLGPTSAEWSLARLLLDVILHEIGYRVNRLMPLDGSERPVNPLPLPVYSTATIPPATAWPGCLVGVNDAPGGPGGGRIQYSDGTSWISL